MRRTSVGTVAVLASILAAAPASAQGKPQMITIPLSSPGEPYNLEISIISARIEVIGEDREDLEFAITVEQGDRKIITPSGTKPITTGAYSLEVDEEDNYVSVETDWRADKVSIVARVPRRGNLDLSTQNDGEIIVSNIAGNLELDNLNGPITATAISGSVIAESLNDNIDVRFSSLDGSEATALISLNGDLSIGIPGNAGAQFYIDAAEGEIYSDFEVELQTSEPIIERREDRGGIEVRVESVIIANVNGGGPVIKLKTLNGDINIRNSRN